MLDKKPIIRTNQLRPGCVIPVGWVFESILLILLVCAVRDLSSNVARIAEAMERLETRKSLLHLNPRAKGGSDMKYEFLVRMQQRHLKAIVGALRFRQRLLAGDVYGTIGRAAMDAWGTLPDVAHGAYPARKGEKGAVQSEVLEACRVIEDAVWRNRQPIPAFSGTPDGRLAAELLSQNKTKERRTRFSVKLRKGVLRKIGWAVEFELRARIGHLEAIVAHLDIGLDVIRRVDSQCERMKAVAWQIVGGNYGPWFTYRTRFLYDIYSAIQHEEGHWRYSTVTPIVPSVPLLEISRHV